MSEFGRSAPAGRDPAQFPPHRDRDDRRSGRPGGGVEPAPAARGRRGRHLREVLSEALQGDDAAPSCDAALERIRTRSSSATTSATVTAPPPLDGVEFVYALNLSRCIGCRKCVHACVAENNQSRDPGDPVHPRARDAAAARIDLEQGNHHYDRRRCRTRTTTTCRCSATSARNPPCVKVCPVEATWQEPDGITVIDYDWCIGCRYCEAACPYWARRFNFTEPHDSRRTSSTRTCPTSPTGRGRKGVMEKCTFCLHRTRDGPAAGLPGGLPDRRPQVRQRARSRTARCRRSSSTKRVFVLKEEVGTLPRFFYYFDERYPGTASRRIRDRPEARDMKDYLRFLWRCFRLSFVGDWRYHALDAAADRASPCSASTPTAQQLVDGLGHDRHDRPGVLGPLHRQLHLPGRAWRPRR